VKTPDFLFKIFIKFRYSLILKPCFMKKVLLAFAAICCIALASSFSLPQNSDEVQDYTNYYVTQPPVADVPLTAYTCTSRAAQGIVICPGEGMRCVVRVLFNGGEVIVTDEKARDREWVENIGSAN
jgi:hypothetical protein